MPSPTWRAAALAALMMLLPPTAYAGPVPAHAAPVTRVAILSAEDRRAPTPDDLATIRAGLQSADAQIVCIAVRALGRLERPALIPDILPALNHRSPEVRAEAATAVAQAAQGWKHNPPDGWTTALDTAATAVIERLKLEPDANVRAALDDTLGRLPYAQASQAETAERALLDVAAAHARSPTDRLGIATGLLRLARLHRNLHPMAPAARTRLIELATGPPSGGHAADARGKGTGRSDAQAAVRARRVALEALLLLGPLEREVIEVAARDADEQVRRQAMRGAAGLVQHDGGAILVAGAGDPSAIVRLEAVRGLVGGHADEPCARLVKAAADAAMSVALMAIDELAKCGGSREAVEALGHEISDLSHLAEPRAWHRPAHALVSLAAASPDRAAASLDRFGTASIWEVRLYAARAAAALKNREMLERLASDADDNVREEAIDALSKLFGHDADAIFLAQLTRTGNQVLRSAATALAGTPHRDQAIPALQSTLKRLLDEGRDNSHDARDAIVKTLGTLGVATEPTSPPLTGDLDAAALQRLAHARVRVTMRGLGAFELTLLLAQAPATVLHIARLAESGYYNGLTFHRVVPDFVIQGGSPGANEYIGEASFMRDEVGLLPHVRGTVGISTRGRDTGDAQIFVNLVDNPRLDHDYTVFAEVSRGMDVIDRILEGDVIERVEIVADRH